MHAAQTKVLIVEDEAIVACDLERRLIKAGYVVPAIAASGEQALASVEQTAPDLVLMDIHLQGATDGIAVAAEVRNRFQLPVVFLTAHADKDTLDRAKATEPFSYLIKPISHVNLASTIEIAISKHRAEQKLRSREAWLQTVLDSMPDAVMVTDSCGGVQFLNATAERLTGWVLADAAGKPLAEVFRLVDSADREVAGEFSAALTAGSAFRLPLELRLIAHDGQAIPVETQLAISPVDGRPSGMVIMLRDVTARHWNERQIRQNQKMLVAGRLAAGIAGDFSRLLLVILKYSEQLLGEMDEGNQFRKRVKAIQRAGYSATALADEALGLCPKAPADARELDLNSVVTRSLPLLSRVAGPSVAIETSLDPGLGKIRAESAQMEQVLFNLVLHARDTMPRGGRVLIQTSNVELPDAQGSEAIVRLAVEDDGAGMDSETAEHLFEPFFSSKRPACGTGLGLAVVHAIVSAADGLISVDGRPGAGSLFEIFLPRYIDR